MRHLLICSEYPPAPIEGGIGTYAFHIARLLAESGETVHVIAQLWEQAPQRIQESCNGRLIVHRVPVDNCGSSLPGQGPLSETRDTELDGLARSSFRPQAFSWQASLLAEELVQQVGIDVIESQEYSAPLYYFQLRRALGLGPKKTPPCIVHMHSPTSFIAKYNDWDLGYPHFATAIRLENYSIASADALLCPSRYLARQIEAQYGLPDGSVRVVPLPIGKNAFIERDPGTWKDGTICYVGRLERRKGTLEWIDAALSVADEFPAAHFAFVGANILCGSDSKSSQGYLDRRIPEHLKKRFHFYGRQKREALGQFLAQARIAVVPSRWENFPNTCVEAMCSGLPVIASPHGGMVEMIEDGRSGWLAASSNVDHLAQALVRALQTPPGELARMGRNAVQDIHKLCDNQKIVQSHLDFREQVVRGQAKHSLHLPATLPHIGEPLSGAAERRHSRGVSESGLALVIICSNTGHLLEQCLEGVEAQTHKPVKVVIVDDASTELFTQSVLNQARLDGYCVIHRKCWDRDSARNVGMGECLRSLSSPLGIAFLTADVRLEPDFAEICESVLRYRREVGIVSCWTRRLGTDGRLGIASCPTFPYQWVSNEVTPFSMMRTEALLEVDDIPDVESPAYEEWALCNSMMAAGWVAVTVPKVLGACQDRQYSLPAMHQRLLGRFPDLVARDAAEIVLLAHSYAAQSMRERLMALRKQDVARQTTGQLFRCMVRKMFGRRRRLVRLGRQLIRKPRGLLNPVHGRSDRRVSGSVRAQGEV